MCVNLGKLPDKSGLGFPNFEENGLHTCHGSFLGLLKEVVRNHLLKHIPVAWNIIPFPIRKHLFSDHTSETESR